MHHTAVPRLFPGGKWKGQGRDWKCVHLRFSTVHTECIGVQQLKKIKSSGYVCFLSQFNGSYSSGPPFNVLVGCFLRKAFKMTCLDLAGTVQLVVW